MVDNIWFEASIWIGLAFAASLISIRLGISVALIEILVGVIAGNFLGVNQTTPWIDFLALLGSGVLTFLAGADLWHHFGLIRFEQSYYRPEIIHHPCYGGYFKRDNPNPDRTTFLSA